MKQWRMLAALVSAGALTACSGPVAPIDVGAKEVRVDMLLGAKVRRVAGAPVPPLLLRAPTQFSAFSPIVRTPTPTFVESTSRRPTTTTTSSPPVVLGPCPLANPLDVPVHEAIPQILKAPRPGQYVYRTIGQLKTTGETETAVTLAPASLVTVTVDPPDAFGNFTFSMRVDNEKAATTTTTYRVVSQGPEVHEPPPQAGVPTVQPPVRPTAPNHGFYLAKVEQAGGLKPFEPAYPGILLARTPLTFATAFDVAGTDGTTSLQARVAVAGKDRVDACGVLLDTWVIEVLGKVGSADGAEVVDFRWILNLGTQYGGIPVKLQAAAFGSAGQSNVERFVSMTINREPELP